MIVINGICAALLGGLGRRVAGGAFQQWTGLDVGDLPVRVFFAGTIAAAVALGGGFHEAVLLGWTFPAWLQVVAVVFAGWVGTTVPMGGIDLGKGSGKVLRSVRGLSLHGVASGAALALVFYAAGLNWYGVALAGAAMPVVYWLGWLISGLRGCAYLPVGLRGGSEIAEAVWGALLALGAFFA